MALSTENREIRAALSRSSPVFSKENYAEYLLSDHWRRQRNAALARAGFRCERCPARKGLQVHHVSYARLGAELTSDLEVLCRSCHEGEHVEQDQREHAGVYIKLVSEVLKSERFTTLADVFDAVKDACRAARIRYNQDAVSMAVRDLDAQRKGILDAPALEPMPTRAPRDERPYGRDEAIGIMQRLNVKIGMREMPKASTLSDEAVNDFKRQFVWKR